MCLGIPGQIVAVDDVQNQIATVDVCGVRRRINITCIVGADHPAEACVGDWVLVHVGFAMSRIDETEALETLRLIDEVAGMQDELRGLSASSDDLEAAG